MIKNYLKVAWRNLIKDRRFAYLNLIGLSTGLACALLIYVWVQDELSIDKFHKNDATLFQVLENRVQASGIWTAKSSPVPMPEALKKDMPEVEYAAYVSPVRQSTLSVKDDVGIKTKGKYADKDFFNMFSFDLMEGNPNQVLADPTAIVLSDVIATKLFGTTENVIGKTVDFQHEQKFVVSGVFKAPDQHSSEQFDFVLPVRMLKMIKENADEWGNTGYYTFITLKPGTNINKFNAKIANYIKLKTNNEITYRTPFIQRYSENYLYGRFENGIQVGGRIDYVRLFSIIAIFILVIACINFMNLSTAKAAGRAKEVGIKKAMGAGRGVLMLQYLGESMVMAFASLLMAILLVFLLLPVFNNLTGKQLSLFHFDTALILSGLGITFFTGLVAGSYPAFHLSGFKPAAVLKGKINGSVGELLIRKGLVVFQFSLSIVLIVAVLVVYRQISFIQTKNLGYDRDHVITFAKEGKLSRNEVSERFLAEVKDIPGVKIASGMGHGLTGHSSGTSDVVWEGKDLKDETEFEVVDVNYDLLKTLDIKIKEGRDFSRDFGADTSMIIFNEAAIKFMGMKDPVGKSVKLWGKDMRIGGVVKDFHFESLHEEVKPLFFELSPENANRFMIKVETGREKAVIARLQEMYLQMNPGFSFDYKFLDERYQTLYAAENQISRLSRYFAGLAILISCLGLFGLAAFTAQRRNKEIGIRKVLGATVGTIVMMLSKDFLRLVLIAMLIAFPVAWWATTQWLKGFAYSIRIDAGIFVVAGISIILLTFLTISFQSVKAALANPVKSLKSE
ncbi:ABC transporter permease [Chitinophaga sp. ARDCPP14]|uniref:ABC transporter permease n=1 Tax=Chitinophaga sp. ARDCPP14 TaxID=3391139 RepID=UPI003F51D40E